MRFLQPVGVWFKCRGCGAPAGYYADGIESGGYGFAAGSITHTKPPGDVNRRPVQCELFQRLEPHEFWALHEHDAKIEAPTNIRPAVD